jgi:hypothetical protein
MPKKKRGAFNPTQIKDGWIVRLRKDGRIAQWIEKYFANHSKIAK